MILLISPKTIYATNRLIEEASKADIPLEVFDIHDLKKQNFEVGVSKYSALYVRQAYPYFPEILFLAKKFLDVGKYVVDSDAITHGLETSKLYMCEKLEKANVLIPKTKPLLSITSFTYPYVLKWIYGFGGNDVFLIQNLNEYQKIILKHPFNEWLVQEYIPTTWEYKVITVGYKSLPIILGFKAISNQFKIDVYKYAIFSPSDKTEVAELAKISASTMGYELAKIDIIEQDGKLFVLEVNRNPGLLPFEPYSKLNVASEFLQFIQRQL